MSGALPGSVHDKKAEWIWGVLDELQAAGLVTLAACHLGEEAACPGVRAGLGAIGWLAVPWQDPAGADSLG